MPTYEYECQSCHERLEAVQKFTDPSLTVCPRCGGELRKVFSAVGIVFKGSGFYKNDSRDAKKTATPSSPTPAAVAPANESSTSTPTPPSSPAPAPAPATAASGSSTSKPAGDS